MIHRAHGKIIVIIVIIIVTHSLSCIIIQHARLRPNAHTLSVHTYSCYTPLGLQHGASVACTTIRPLLADVRRIIITWLPESRSDAVIPRAAAASAAAGVL